MKKQRKHCCLKVAITCLRPDHRAQYDVTADGRRFLMLVSAPTDGAGGRVRFVAVQNRQP